jgi:hypothetical protein
VLHALCEERREDFRDHLALDYGNPHPLREQYWKCRRGEEVTRFFA